MERFGPLPGEPVAECERKARESDVVVCIVAHRYGFVPEKGRGSITRREVEAAKAAGKDVLVWIVADDHPWTEKKEQDLLTDPDGARRPGARGGGRGGRAGAGRVQGLAAGDLRLRHLHHSGRTGTQDRRRPVEPFRTPNALSGASAEAAARSASSMRSSPRRISTAATSLVKELTDWVADPASPDRVWSLVAAGGTGKTAVVERVVARHEARRGQRAGLVVLRAARRRRLPARVQSALPRRGGRAGRRASGTARAGAARRAAAPDRARRAGARAGGRRRRPRARRAVGPHPQAPASSHGRRPRSGARRW